MATVWSVMPFLLTQGDNTIMFDTQQEDIRVFNLQENTVMVKCDVVAMCNRSGIGNYRVSIRGFRSSVGARYQSFQDDDTVVCWNARGIHSRLFVPKFNQLLERFSPKIVIVTNCRSVESNLASVRRGLGADYSIFSTTSNGVGGAALFHDTTTSPYFYKLSSNQIGHCLGVEVVPRGLQNSLPCYLSCYDGIDEDNGVQ